MDNGKNEYRVVRKTFEYPEGTTKDYYGIFLVNIVNNKVRFMGAEPDSIFSENIEDISNILKDMRAALKKEVLDFNEIEAGIKENMAGHINRKIESPVSKLKKRIENISPEDLSREIYG